MNQHGRQQEIGERNSDIEKQFGRQDDGVDRHTILDPKGAFMFKWHLIFVVSCVIAVLCVDPLFFYLAVINEDDKCIALDKGLKITAICLRSVFDMIYIANIILGYFSRRSGRNRLVTDAQLITKRYLSSYFLIYILAILPIPQVLVPIIFSKMTRWKFLDLRELLNFFVLLQYVPRVLRIYLSWKKHIESSMELDSRVWIKVAFNIFLYILVSHVLGGLWYFFSIQREMACWDVACENHIGCYPSAFKCARNLGNYTFFGENCPVHKPNTTLFDFGIFQEALQSGTVSSTNIPQKIMHCFWWGLRNLSSLGQNLQTSTYFWEDCFAVFISIFGLLLFLFFIGNAQTYIQMGIEKATKKAEMEAEKTEEIRRKMEPIKSKIESWMARNQLPCNMKEPIINCIQHKVDNKDFDIDKPILHLSKDLITEIKHHLCLPLLKKVPNLDENLLERICESLKPKYYNEGICILGEGEPLMMLVITHGSVCCFKSGENGEGTNSSAQYIEKGKLYGEELLEWGFNRSPSQRKLVPTSSKTVKTQSTVEAFALTANDLKNLVPMLARAASAAKGFAQGVMRHLKEKKNENSPKMAKQNSTSNHFENSRPAVVEE